MILCKTNWTAFTCINPSKHQDTFSLLENVNSFSIYMINLTEKRSWSKRFNKLKVSLVSLGVVLKTTAVSQYVSLFGKFPKFVQKYFKPQKWYSMKSRSFVCLRESPACEAMWVIWRYCPPTLSSLFMFSQGFSIAINVLIFSSLTLGIIDGEFRQKRFKEEYYEVSLQFLMKISI